MACGIPGCQQGFRNGRGSRWSCDPYFWEEIPFSTQVNIRTKAKTITSYSGPHQEIDLPWFPLEKTFLYAPERGTVGQMSLGLIKFTRDKRRLSRKGVSKRGLALDEMPYNPGPPLIPYLICKGSSCNDVRLYGYCITSLTCAI